MNLLLRIVCLIGAGHFFLLALIFATAFIAMMIDPSAEVGQGLLEYGWFVAILTSVIGTGIPAGIGLLFVWGFSSLLRSNRKKRASMGSAQGGSDGVQKSDPWSSPASSKTDQVGATVSKADDENASSAISDLRSRIIQALIEKSGALRSTGASGITALRIHQRPVVIGKFSCSYKGTWSAQISDPSDKDANGNRRYEAYWMPIEGRADVTALLHNGPNIMDRHMRPDDPAIMANLRVDEEHRNLNFDRMHEIAGVTREKIWMSVEPTVRYQAIRDGKRQSPKIFTKFEKFSGQIDILRDSFDVSFIEHVSFEIAGVSKTFEGIFFTKSGAYVGDTPMSGSQKATIFLLFIGLLIAAGIIVIGIGSGWFD